MCARILLGTVTYGAVEHDAALVMLQYVMRRTAVWSVAQHTQPALQHVRDK